MKRLLFGIRNFSFPNFTLDILLKYRKFFFFFFFLDERKIKIYEFRDYSKINSSFTVNK